MRKSAGILAFRVRDSSLEVFLVHPGGPFWQGKETGAWSIPKGEFTEEEDPLAAACREFREETGQEVNGEFIALTPVKQKAGKMVYAWAVKADVDAENIVSNSFKMEYPYKSGKWITVPEVDKAGWFRIKEAKEKINPAQAGFLDELLKRMA
jgi:predicted NUDIX family NTP pyrophosphohydrolase